LTALLQEFVTLDGARLALVVDWDGSMLQGRTRDRKLSMESIGAAISSSLGSTQVLGRELRVGGASLVSLEYQQGTLLIRVLGSTGILAILADAEANLGRLRVQLNKRASAFESLG
jgi:predicted regulator of Ras-like GTPase activity (Roadblock/LC7/MglB family)